MIREHDRVVLQVVLSELGLKAGDVGTVVHMYRMGKAFEVEFLGLNGETMAIATAEAGQVRPVQKGEIAHARMLAVA